MLQEIAASPSARRNGASMAPTILLATTSPASFAPTSSISTANSSPAHARHRSGGVNTAEQARRDFLEEAVSRAVAEAVVDRLEVVEVDEEEGAARPP
jgi:hypothetical protein